MLSEGGGSRAVLRACLNGQCQPVVGYKLFREYEDVLARPRLFRNSRLSPAERESLLNAFLRVCEWTDVYFLWRPNLPDESDNHLIELAVAGSAETIVTLNPKDLRGGELRFAQLRIETPQQFLERWRQSHGDDDHSNG